MEFLNKGEKVTASKPLNLMLIEWVGGNGK